MCTLFISCNNVYEKFIILYTCLFWSERTPPKLILNLQVSLMPLVRTICLFCGGINITLLGIHNVAPTFTQASLYALINCMCFFKSIFPTPTHHYYCQYNTISLTM